MFRDECKMRVVDSREEKLIREKSSKRCVTLYNVASMGKYSYEAFTEDSFYKWDILKFNRYDTQLLWLFYSLKGI